MSSHYPKQSDHGWVDSVLYRGGKFGGPFEMVSLDDDSIEFRHPSFPDVVRVIQAQTDEDRSLYVFVGPDDEDDLDQAFEERSNYKGKIFCKRPHRWPSPRGCAFLSRREDGLVQYIMGNENFRSAYGAGGFIIANFWPPKTIADPLRWAMVRLIAAANYGGIPKSAERLAAEAAERARIEEERRAREAARAAAAAAARKARIRGRHLYEEGNRAAIAAYDRVMKERTDAGDDIFVANQKAAAAAKEASDARRAEIQAAYDREDAAEQA